MGNIRKQSKRSFKKRPRWISRAQDGLRRFGLSTTNFFKKTWVRVISTIFIILTPIGLVLGIIDASLSISDRVATCIARQKTEQAASPAITPTWLSSTLDLQSTPSLAATHGVVFCTPPVVNEECLYLPTLGNSWPLIATLTSYEDECRWPEIANINRDPSGEYREAAGILYTAGIQIPDSRTAIGLPPQIRNNNGTFKPVPPCEKDEPYFPCVYMVVEGDGLTGSNYASLASMFYHALVKEGVDLESYIKNANLVDGCKKTPLLLQPGVMVVIPRFPRNTNF